MTTTTASASTAREPELPGQTVVVIGGTRASASRPPASPGRGAPA